MKHYQAPDGKLYAYEPDGSQDDLIPSDYVFKTEEQVAAIRAAEETAKQPQYMATAMTYFRETRERFISRILDIGTVTREETGNSEVMAKALLIRRGLLDLPKHPTVLAATTLAEQNAAMLTVYRALLVDAPPELVRAFAEIDQ